MKFLLTLCPPFYGLLGPTIGSKRHAHWAMQMQVVLIHYGSRSLILICEKRMPNAEYFVISRRRNIQHISLRIENQTCGPYNQRSRIKPE